MFESERELSQHCYKTNDSEKYREYLKCKAQEREFYVLKKWRNWKFRLYSQRKSSQIRIADVYGANCTIYYGGDWSMNRRTR